MGAAADDSGGVAIGTLLAGRYRIERVLGSGGMGRVYRGEHTTMGKPVAVKVLHAALGRNPEAAMRFEREAIASGRLDHPNIVSVTDFGVLDDGRLYLVMEALEGEHLGQRLVREKRIPWPEALVIARSVLLGLRHAHDRGVVHRDVKPDNIFLAGKDGETIVKVLDFGIAKIFLGNTDDQTATRAGITVGTPTYLSPEQATGGAITPASDIYSASIVLYEMLVGRAPFEAEDPLALLTAHVGGEVPPFSAAAPGVEIPEAVEQLVFRGLTKIPVERIDSFELLQEIDEILRAHGIEPAPAQRAVRASRSMAIPTGPFTHSTPMPSAFGRATPTPCPAFTPRLPDTKAAPRTSIAPSRPSRRKWVVLAALAVLAAAGAAFAVSTRRTSQPATAAEHTPTPTTAAPPARTRAPTTDEHDAQLKRALHDLQEGATCSGRKKAITKLVELGDQKAVPSIKKARARGQTNACLREAADHAIKVLDGRI